MEMEIGMEVERKRRPWRKTRCENGAVLFNVWLARHVIRRVALMLLFGEQHDAFTFIYLQDTRVCTHKM